MRLRLLAVAVVLVSLESFAPAAEPGVDPKLAKTASAIFDKLETDELPNGLRVFLLPIKGSPVVTTMVAYKVGSGDEDKDQTGLSHYLEHLLFKGTEKLMPGDIDRATQRNGGHNNAYTNVDMTNYHFDFAADRWPIALEIEADRMRNVRIDEKHEFQQEKGAVVAELKKNEDGPWDLESKSILPFLYAEKAPYSHPIIGQEKHVRGATAEIIRRHYDKWYHPNNATLVMVGGFDLEQARTLIKKLFGSIPKGELPSRNDAAIQTARTAQVRSEFPSKFDVPRMMAAFNGVRLGEADDYVLDVIGDILASGKTSRLYRKLVEGEQLANEVGGGNFSGRYPGWFSVNVEMLQGKDRAKAEKIVFEELEKLSKEPVSVAELVRVKRSKLASAVFEREAVHELADAIARTATVRDVDYLKTYIDRVNAVSATDIQRVCAKYLAKSKSAVVWSLPVDAKAGAGGEKPMGEAKRQAAGATPSFTLTDAKRTVLPNGLTLITLENRRLPIVVATASVNDVRLREPAAKAGVAALMGEMLEEGTAKHTGEQISTAIEDTGGSLSLSSSGGSVKVLTPDADLGLGLLIECLTQPSFPKDALERKRDQVLSTIADIETQPSNRGQVLFQATVYGDHPFGRSRYGKKEVVQKLTVKDLKAFHTATFVPNETTLVVVGDFDTAEMTTKVEALTANWKKVELTKPKPAAPPKADKPVETIVSDATAAQTHVFIGHLGITRDNPDYYTLLVLDNVLGTGPGFTDRLSANLRDRQGLAYTVRAQIAASAAEQPGMFAGYIGTFPEKYLIAKEGFLTEIGKIRAEAPSPQEVDDAKKYLLGSLPFSFTTNDGIAGQLLAAERYKLGFDFLETYRTKVAAVTPAAVHAAAQKYLDPKRLVIVAVGPIGQDGKPLPAPKK